MSHLPTICHKMRLIFIVVFVITMCYPILINSAVIRGPNSKEQLQQILLEEFNNTRIPRATNDSYEDDDKTRICNTVCGWLVYNRNTRDIQYYMKNLCECLDTSYKCVRTGEDLSASAYVYRCRQNTTENDILAPSTESPEDSQYF